MRYMRLTGLIGLLLPIVAYADPLDRGEAYTTRQSPPKWMDGVDFTWLIVDYGLFALTVALLGWVLMRRPAIFEKFEALISSPFRLMFAGALHLPILVRELAQGIIGLSILLLIVAWVFLCQWLSHHSFGAVSMAGLALEAVILVRLIRGDERAQPI